MDIEEFIEKFSGRKMGFISYYKYKFTYEFIDGNDTYIVVCGDVTGDIYRDSWGGY